MRKLAVAALCVLLALALPACSSTSATSSVSGTMVRGEGRFYSIGTTYLIRMADTTPATPRLIAESEETLLPGWEAPGTSPPLDFTLEYETNRIDDSHTYVVWAEVRTDGKIVAESRATRPLGA